MVTKLITKKGKDGKQETPQGKNKTQPYSEIQQVTVTWKDRINPFQKKKGRRKRNKGKRINPIPCFLRYHPMKYSPLSR